MLANGGVVWLGVDYRHVDDVRRIFSSRGWEVKHGAFPSAKHEWHAPSVLLEASYQAGRDEL